MILRSEAIIRFAEIAFGNTRQQSKKKQQPQRPFLLQNKELLQSRKGAQK